MANRHIIKCVKCSWSRVVDNNNDPEQVKDLFEYKSCTKCKQFRRFRCPKCGQIAKQLPIKN